MPGAPVDDATALVKGAVVSDALYIRFAAEEKADRSRGQSGAQRCGDPGPLAAFSAEPCLR